jgi:hypothetical protein
MLVKEVRDNFTLRYFCHLPLSDHVPDSTTLIKPFYVGLFAAIMVGMTAVIMVSLLGRFVMV